MNFELYVARRYLFSKKSTNVINIISGISVVGVAVATTALIVTLSVFNGFSDLVATLFTAFDPQLEVAPVQGKTAPADDPVLTAIRQLPQVDVATECVEDMALVIYNDRQAMVTIKGVDDNFDRLTHIREILYGDGTFELHAADLQYGIPGIRVAEQLGMGFRFDGPLQVFAPRREGQVDVSDPADGFVQDELYSPGVLFSVMQPKYDKGYVLTSVAFARRLFDQQGMVSSVELRLKPGSDFEAVKKEMRRIAGNRFTVKDRYEQQDDTFRIMKIEKLMAYIFLTFILVVACFNIIGSLSMLIIDKRDDVTTLRNLGASDKQITRIFLFEGRMISAIGAVIGVAVGLLLCWLQQTFGIIALGSSAGSFIVDAYPVSVHPTDVVLVFITVIAVGFVSVWYPVRYFAKRLLNKRMLTLGMLFLSTMMTTNAQTFYELSYQDNDDLCMGLLTYTDDSHCHMRLTSYKKRKHLDADYECVIKTDEKNDSTRLVCYMPTQKKMPALVWAIEGSDFSELTGVPLIAHNLKKRDKWTPAISFREVSLEDMTPDYLRQYYDEDEPAFESLLAGFQRMTWQRKLMQEEEMMHAAKHRDTPMPTSGTDEHLDKATFKEPEPDKLFLIVTANTNVSDIGMACTVDLNRVRSEFAGIAKVVGLQLRETIVANNDYSRESLVKAVEKLSPSANDVVVFVYSGHGFRFQNQKDYYPNMDLSPTAYDAAEENYLPLSLVYDSITVKGARLNIVLSDCCNSDIDLDMPIINSNSLFSRSNKNFDRQKMRRLFLDATGNVIATAASPGEVSWCGSNGGFFLLSVIESLRNQVSALNDETPSWDKLLQNAIDAAAQKSESNQNCKKQNGLKYVKVKDA